MAGWENPNAVYVDLDTENEIRIYLEIEGLELGDSFLDKIRRIPAAYIQLQPGTFEENAINFRLIMTPPGGQQRRIRYQRNPLPGPIIPEQSRVEFQRNMAVLVIKKRKPGKPWKKEIDEGFFG